MHTHTHTHTHTHMLDLSDVQQTQSAFSKTSGSEEGGAVARQRQTLSYQTLPYPGGTLSKSTLGVSWRGTWGYPEVPGSTLGYP